MPSGLTDNRTVLRIECVGGDLAIAVHRFPGADTGMVIGKRDVQTCALETLELAATCPGQRGAAVPVGGIARVAIICDVGDCTVEIDLRQQITPLGVAVGQRSRAGGVALAVGAGADVAVGVVGVVELVVQSAARDGFMDQLVLGVVPVYVHGSTVYWIAPLGDLPYVIIIVVIVQGSVASLPSGDFVGHKLDL